MKSMTILGSFLLAAVPLFGAAVYTSTPYYPVFSAPGGSAFPGLSVQLIRPNLAAECGDPTPFCEEADRGSVVIGGWPGLDDVIDVVRITHDRQFDGGSGNLLRDFVLVQIGWLRTYDPHDPNYGNMLELMPAGGWMTVDRVGLNLYRVEGELGVSPFRPNPWGGQTYDPVTLYTGIPEPTGTWPVGIGLVGVAALRRHTR
jgi:hypothetical protein